MPQQTFADILDAIRASSDNEVEKGQKFEAVTKSFLKHDPLYKSLFTDVWLWSEWPGRQGRPDTGIDLVAENVDDDKFTAIQCKCYLPDQTVSKPDIDSFLSTSGTTEFSKRLIVSTTEKWNKNAEETLEAQQIPVARIGVAAFEASAIDWSEYDIGKPDEMPQWERKKPMEHQEEAIGEVLNGFKIGDRGKLIMACGTGKTYTSLQIAERHVSPGGTVLFLAPSITLVSQSLRDWGNDASKPMRFHAVCSDTKVGRTGHGGDDTDDTNEIAAYDLVSPATTSPEVLNQSQGEMRRRMG